MGSKPGSFVRVTSALTAEPFLQPLIPLEVKVTVRMKSLRVFLLGGARPQPAASLNVLQFSDVVLFSELH